MELFLQKNFVILKKVCGKVLEGDYGMEEPGQD
jgi:hypothetical protein